MELDDDGGPVEIKTSMIYNEQSFHMLNDNNDSKPPSRKDSRRSPKSAQLKPISRKMSRNFGAKPRSSMKLLAGFKMDKLETV